VKVIPIIDLRPTGCASIEEQLAWAAANLPLDEPEVAIQVVLPPAFLPHLASAIRQASLRRVEETAARRPAHVFRREGDYFTISCNGREFHLRATKGLAHLAFLLRHPHEDVPALALAALLDTVTEGEREPEADRAWQLAPSTAQSGLEVIDDETPARYRRRLDELESDAARARGLGDTKPLTQLTTERTAILKALSAGHDKKGRPRLTHDGAERARQNVRRAIIAAITKIEREDAACGLHLRRSVRTGHSCIYKPDTPLPWTFS
jgi:hypothetical protein